MKRYYSNLEGLARAGVLLSSQAWAARNALGPATGSVYAAAARGFSSRAQFFDALTLPSRKGLFSDAVAVSGLLPNRKEFFPQFSPHGITLVPKSILQSAAEKAAPALTGADPAAAAAASTLRLAAARAKLSAMHAHAAEIDRRHQAELDLDGDVHPDRMEASDKTKVWRRLKIKKHKIKKRRKDNRYKNDK